MRKLGCNASALLGNDIPANMECIKAAGFDCTFISWNDGADIDGYMKKAASIGLAVETFHAPFDKMNSMWEESVDGDEYTELLRRCIKAAGHYDVPYVIMHTTIGRIVPKTSPIGLLRYHKLIVEAEKQGVKLAFENLEYVRHLELILDYFKSENVGFCYDVGHEHCYTPGIKYMPIFGDRLFCTHIHDNLGLAPTKDVDYRDDLHRIPFDGNIDYDAVCRGIKQSGYKGSLMLEISNRTPYLFYDGLSPMQFYTKAYEAAQKLRALCDGN
ncbi:MAG: sugar phosphate isomerase/epimerase [Clostridia bacterium]|nr:sugar phosphate isomerase/epimerase [Clostridia bacterium]